MIPLLFLLLLPTLAVINTTANIPVPLSVHVTGTEQGGSGTATATSTPIFDTATISTLIGLGTAVAYRWKKSSKHEETFKDRTVTAAETTMTQAESLKQTDLGIEDLLSHLSGAIGLIPNIPPQAKQLIDSQLDAWKKDNEAYYVNTPAKATDLSTDPVVKKLGEVQKISTKND